MPDTRLRRKRQYGLACSVVGLQTSIAGGTSTRSEVGRERRRKTRLGGSCAMGGQSIPNVLIKRKAAPLTSWSARLICHRRLEDISAHNLTCRPQPAKIMSKASIIRSPVHCVECTKVAWKLRRKRRIVYTLPAALLTIM